MGNRPGDVWVDKRRLILWTDKYKRGRDVDVFILRRGKVNKSHWNFLWNMNISRTVQKHTDTQSHSWVQRGASVRRRSEPRGAQAIHCPYYRPTANIHCSRRRTRPHFKPRRALIWPITAAVTHMDLSPGIRANIQDSGGVVQSCTPDINRGKSGNKVQFLLILLCRQFRY